MHRILLSLALLFSTIRKTTVQAQTSTSVVVVPGTTEVVETTLTSYSPDTTVTVTPTIPASPQYTNPTDFVDSILNSTNFYRWEHNATFLKWNASLVTYATNWANQCMWEHSHGEPGENLARGYTDVVSAVDAWGDERSMYNFDTPTGFTEATGHFTQLVWKSTQTVGCAAVNCNETNGVQGWFLVCEYWPAGNVVGTGSLVNAYFKVNVQDEINSGQGYNYASATAGASGVGTSWATSAPTVTVTASNNAGRTSLYWEVGLVGGAMALLGVMGT